jgi:Tol biopolymer transport system component
LWLATNNTILALSEYVPGFSPLSDLINIGWSPDSTKIIFEALAPDMAGSNPSTQYFVVDLSENTFTQLIDRVDKGRLSHITNEVVVVFSHCGAPCQEVIVVNYQGQKLWQPEWRIGGFVSYSSDNQFFINIGRSSTSGDGGIPDATVDRIDLQTGSLDIIWQMSRQNGYFAMEQPTISPDGRFITFNFMPPGVEWNVLGTLYLIDLNGRIYHECEACLVLDWQPEGGPVVVQFLSSGENQLVYLPLDGSLPRVFVTPKLFTFGSGKWSPDGRYFVYSAFDEAAAASYLYLWWPGDGEPTLIHATASNEPFNHFAWMPDSSGFYFNAKRTYTELWWYRVETAEIQQIRATKDEGVGYDYNRNLPLVSLSP